MIDFIKQDKIAAYAMATEDDISAVRFEQVRNSAVWRGYMGTVYGCRVASSDQVGFDTFDEARNDAVKFVEQCREIRARGKND